MFFMHNFNPEKKVEQQVLAWYFQNHWSMSVFDSEMIRGPKNKMVRNPGIPTGCPDTLGCTDQGLAAFVELKKHGFRHICRLSQRQFLERKIQSNAFGIVTDSTEHLSKTYSSWLSLRSESLQKAREFLISELPRKVLVDGKILILGL
jgi:hypothetical protein